MLDMKEEKCPLAEMAAPDWTGNPLVNQVTSI